MRPQCAQPYNVSSLCVLILSRTHDEVGGAGFLAKREHYLLPPPGLFCTLAFKGLRGNLNLKASSIFTQHILTFARKSLKGEGTTSTPPPPCVRACPHCVSSLQKERYHKKIPKYFKYKFYVFCFLKIIFNVNNENFFANFILKTSSTVF